MQSVAQIAEFILREVNQHLNLIRVSVVTMLLHDSLDVLGGYACLVDLENVLACSPADEESSSP
jgi:hypothetical protein